MKQKVQAFMEIIPAMNITEACYMIGLIRYYKKFFPVFNDIMQLLNKLTKKEHTIQMDETMSKSLDYMRPVMTSSPILIYPDPDKQYYLFTDSAKDSWSGILIQYQEQVRENWTIVNVPHSITYQSGIFQGSQKNWSVLAKKSL